MSFNLLWLRKNTSAVLEDIHRGRKVDCSIFGAKEVHIWPQGDQAIEAAGSQKTLQRSCSLYQVIWAIKKEIILLAKTALVKNHHHHLSPFVMPERPHVPPWESKAAGSSLCESPSARTDGQEERCLPRDNCNSLLV